MQSQPQYPNDKILQSLTKELNNNMAFLKEKYQQKTQQEVPQKDDKSR